MSSRQEQKKRLREQREAEQKAAEQAQQRKQRTALIAGGVALIALVVVVVLVVASQSSDDKQASTSDVFAGVPMNGITLGDPDAPVTVGEFADLQCPFCKQFAITTYPVIVNDYVSKGKVRIESRTMTFIGPDSEKAARAAAAAGEQDREAYFTQLWFFNQGQENSGYATDEFIEKIWKAAGVDVAKAKTFADSDAALKPVTAAQQEAEKYGIVSTPSFLIGETGKPLTKFDVNLDDADAFAAAFDELLK